MIDAQCTCGAFTGSYPDGHSDECRLVRLGYVAPALLEACRTAHARLTAMVLVDGHHALAPTLQMLGDAIETATKEQ